MGNRGPEEKARQHFNDHDLLDWGKDTFHVTLKYFIDVINKQLSLYPPFASVVSLALKSAAFFVVRHEASGTKCDSEIQWNQMDEKL